MTSAISNHPGRSAVRQNLRITTIDGVLATPWVFAAVPGNLILAALLTQYFAIGTTAYGVIASLPAWSNAAQILVIFWLSRYLTPRDMTLGLGWFNVGLWSIFVLVLGYLPRGGGDSLVGLFVGFFAMASLSLAFIGVGWVSWVREFVPTSVSGTYFGRRNRWISLVTVGFLLVALGLFHVAEHALWPYQVLIGTAVVARYASLICQNGIRAGREDVPVRRENWVTHVRECAKTPGLIVFILFAAWSNFWLAFVGPFVPVFCFEELHLTPGGFTGLVVTGSVFGMLGYTVFGRLTDRMGSLPVLVIGMIAWEAQNYLWLVLNPGNTWLLYPMWAWGGFFSVGYLLGTFNLLLKLLPNRSRVAGTSLYLAVTSVTAGIAPIIAGAVLARFAGDERLVVYDVGFAVKPTALLFGLLALRGFKEPKRSAQGGVPGAFRTLRHLIGVTGPGILANLTPLGRRRK